MGGEGEWEPDADNWVRWARTPGHDAYWYYRDSFFDGVIPPAGRRTLEREFSARDAALKADEQRLADLRRKQSTLAKSEADALQREVDALDRSIKRNRDGMRSELKARSDQELDRSWREINDAVVEFAREQGYDLIVPSPVVYASPRVDITDKILDRLRRAATKAPAP